MHDVWYGRVGKRVQSQADEARYPSLIIAKNTKKKKACSTSCAEHHAPGVVNGTLQYCFVLHRTVSSIFLAVLERCIRKHCCIALQKQHPLSLSFTACARISLPKHHACNTNHCTSCRLQIDLRPCVLYESMPSTKEGDVLCLGVPTLLPAYTQVGTRRSLPHLLIHSLIHSYSHTVNHASLHKSLPQQ